MSLGRSIGHRVTIKKLPAPFWKVALSQVLMPRLRIEVWRHVLHPTKGWRLDNHSIKTVSRNEYRKAPMKQMGWFPVANWKRNPRANDLPSLETPLTRARHHHPWHMRWQAIVRAGQEMREAAL